MVLYQAWLDMMDSLADASGSGLEGAFKRFKSSRHSKLYVRDDVAADIAWILTASDGRAVDLKSAIIMRDCYTVA